MNHDIWHTVTVRIDVHGARLIAKVDNISAERIIQGLHKSSNYGISTDLTSVVLIGGMNIIYLLYKIIIKLFINMNDIDLEYIFFLNCVKNVL